MNFIKTVFLKLRRWYLRHTKVWLRLSDDGSLFYVDCDRAIHGFWMESKAMDGPTPEKLRKMCGGLFSPMVIQTTQNDGTTKHRVVYPFVWWKVRSSFHRREKVSWADDRVQDWLACRKEF
jgi:hypothetical protein